jgi:hypothetical protein
LRFPLVWPPEEQELTADQVRGAAKIVAMMHRDIRYETYRGLKRDPAPLELWTNKCPAGPVLRGSLAKRNHHLGAGLMGGSQAAPAEGPGPKPARPGEDQSRHAISGIRQPGPTRPGGRASTGFVDKLPADRLPFSSIRS